MDVSSAIYLSELDVEDPMFAHHNYPMNSFAADHFSFQYSSIERPAKLRNTNSRNSCVTEQETGKAAFSCSSRIISFGGTNSKPTTDCLTISKDEVDFKGNMTSCLPPLISLDFNSNEKQNSSLNSDLEEKRVPTSTRGGLHAQDHLLAERKRREKLSQRLIALSALIPGLKKVDKASILGDAVNYLKQLQERVKTLEEQTEQKPVESVSYVVKESRLSCDKSSLDQNRSSQLLFPEIEARVSNKNVLIRIHCKKHKGLVAKVLGELERLHLTVISSSVLPFGNNVMDVTVVAQMGPEYSMTVEDLAKNLGEAFLTKSI